MPYVERFQAIQQVLGLYESPRYLEIGVSKGVTFHRIEAAQKVAVDPHFDFNWETARRERGPSSEYHQVTSDEYFGSLVGEDQKFDVIFVDGLHTFDQTLRDLLNAVFHLAAGGVILIDDVRPPTYHASLSDHLRSVQVRQFVGGDTKDWMGDVYRLVWFIDTFCQQLTYRTIEENHGVAVVWRRRRAQVTERSVREVSDLSFEDLVLGQDVLNLRPLEKIMAELRRDLSRPESRPAPRWDQR